MPAANFSCANSDSAQSALAILNRPLSRRALVAGAAAALAASAVSRVLPQGLQGAARPALADEAAASGDATSMPTDDAIWSYAWRMRYGRDSEYGDEDNPQPLRGYIDGNGNLVQDDSCDLVRKAGELAYYADLPDDAARISGNAIPARWAYDAINLPAAWEALDGALPGADVSVGVFDTAIYCDHEDLAGIGLDASINSGKDWKDHKNGHGTRVAGIIAASANNGTGEWGGTVGVAYGCIMTNYAYGGSELAEEFKAGLSNLIGERYCQVINCSNGKPASEGDNDALAEINDANSAIVELLNGYLDEGRDFVICKAAGNMNSTSDPYYFDEGFEGGQNAALDILAGIEDERIKSRIIVVGAVEPLWPGEGALVPTSFRVAAYSANGERVDVVAPGTLIYSPCPYVPYWQRNPGDSEYSAAGNALNSLLSGLVGNDQPETDSDGCIMGSGYWGGTGTSFATPIVSGIAAMVWGANSKLTGPEVKEIICGTATRQCSYADGVANGGRTDYPLVDAAAAVREALARAAGETWYYGALSSVRGGDSPAYIETASLDGNDLVITGALVHAESQEALDALDFWNDPSLIDEYQTYRFHITDATQVTISERMTASNPTGSSTDMTGTEFIAYCAEQATNAWWDASMVLGSANRLSVDGEGNLLTALLYS